MAFPAERLHARFEKPAVLRLPHIACLREPLAESQMKGFVDALVSEHAIKRLEGVRALEGNGPALREILDSSLYRDARDEARALLGKIPGREALAKFLEFLVDEAPVHQNVAYHERLRAFITGRFGLDVATAAALEFFSGDWSALHNFAVIASSGEVREAAARMRDALRLVPDSGS